MRARMADRIEKCLTGPEGPDVEMHCRVCRAVERHCPTHAFDERWEAMPGRKGTMAPGPGIVARRGNGYRPAKAGPYGYFMGDPEVRWSGSGDRVYLTADFTYVDRAAMTWTVPKGAILEGSSIPRAFWPLVGMPFRGRYRYAALIHDYYCVDQSQNWPEVHEMLYGAALASGVSSIHAKILYYAAYHFGYRWRGEAERSHPPYGLKLMPEEYIEVLRVERWVVERDPSPAEIVGTPPEDIGYPRSKPLRR